MAGPLDGVRVVELAGIGPGPFAGMLLADMGADVLRIDRTGAVGDDQAPMDADVLSRGRRSVAVDLKHPDGREVVLRLVERADALVEGFRRGHRRSSSSAPSRSPTQKQRASRSTSATVMLLPVDRK